MSAPRNRWIAFHKPRPESRLRLFCFPFAGGSAVAYRDWSQALPPAVEVVPVELPGRSSRFSEPALRRVEEVVEGAGEALRPLFDKPFAFFGHSMGALLAFEITRWLRARSLPQPLHLFASARPAPQIPDREPPVHALPEDEFVTRLRDYNGTPEEVLAHPELMKMLLPLLRADFEVNETYVYEPGEPLACPISALGGVRDAEVERADLEAWREQTSGAFNLRMLDGDHFYLLHDKVPLYQAVVRELVPHLG
jgi:medium-chain acyl-[acyl-carrier-protein] hydrolase